ncbi:MAG: transcriptional regulator [Candidatus Riflebacteria bacterium RBG_13_59_9]|nr:MAG: transcriptional regulator [Candidatus Riflebacteria bacterium RBG_13_59_9]
MSGHNKWANIKIRKGAQDAKRGKVFSKLIREVTVATREGGADLDTNASLKVAVSRARDANIPKDTIEKAIARSSGESGGSSFERTTYEGYGPLGIAILVEVLTDNKNRAVAYVRSIFSRAGGNLGESGCVSWLFQRKGQFTISKGSRSEDELLEIVLESGAEDFKEEEDAYYIHCDPASFSRVREYLVEHGIDITSSDIVMIPNTTVEVTKEKDAEKLLRLLEALEDSDDVQKVHANWEMSDALMEQFTS